MANSRDDLEKKLTALEKKAVAGAVKAAGKQARRRQAHRARTSRDAS